MSGKKHSIFYSIQFKIICITLALFFVFAAITTYFWYDELTEQATKTATNNLASIMKVSNKNFETAFKDLNSITALISSNFGRGLNTRVFNYLLSGESDDATILQYRRDAEDYISSLCNFKSYLNGLAVYDLKGNSLSYGLVMSSNDIKQQPWFASLLTTKKDVVFLPPHYNGRQHTQKSSLVFSIVRPIRYREETIGFVVADVKAALLNDMFNIENLNNYSLLIIEDSTKEVIFPTEKSSADLSFLTSDSSSITDNYTLELYNQKYIAVTQKAALTDWTVVGLVPYNTILSDFIVTRSKVLIIALICGVIIILCILAFTSIVTHNLKTLAKEVSKIDSEHLELAVSIQSNDESRLLYDQINFMLQRIKELINNIKSTESQKREYEIRALQAQINPHFLHNTLNTIEFLASVQGANNIKSATHALSDMLYMNLSSDKMITIEQEVAYLKNYLELQDYRYNGKFSSFFSVEDGLNNCLIPKLLLQPLIENSLLHGIVSNTRPGIIQVQVFSQDDRLNIRIKDNGKGMDTNTIKKVLASKDNNNSRHIGIANIRDRLVLLFDTCQSFSIVSEPNLYTMIELSIPLMNLESSYKLNENNDCR